MVLEIEEKLCIIDQKHTTPVYIVMVATGEVVNTLKVFNGHFTIDCVPLKSYPKAKSTVSI